MRTNATQKTVRLAFLTAAGILLQLIESFFPVVMIVPGYKLGLANITGLFTLYAYGIKDMWIVTGLRVFIAALAQGTLFSVSFALSLTGGILGLAAMSLAYKSGWFSIYGVSTAGAAAHSFGQGMAISVIYQQFFMQLYLPVLTALSIVSGLAIAMLTGMLLTRLHFRTGLEERREDGRSVS